MEEMEEYVYEGVIDGVDGRPGYRMLSRSVWGILFALGNIGDWKYDTCNYERVVYYDSQKDISFLIEKRRVY